MSGLHNMKSDQSAAASRRANQLMEEDAQVDLSGKESFLSMRSTRVVVHPDKVVTPRNDVTLNPTHEPRRLGDSVQLRPTIRGGAVLPPSRFEQSMDRIIAAWTFLLSGQKQPIEVDSVWTTAHAHALRILPSFFISNRRWSECKRVICSLCYVSESIRILGMGTTKDNFTTLAAAGKYFDDCSADETEAFEHFLTFVHECAKERHEQRNLGSLLLRAERCSLQSCKSAARSVVSNVRAMISQAEDFMVSPGTEEISQHEKPGMESVFQHLRCFESKGGADALSRPWKARLYAVLDRDDGASRTGGHSPGRESMEFVSAFSENFEATCQQLYQESHAAGNTSYVNEQHSISTQALSMVLERQPVVLIAGSLGIGKSAVLSMLYAGLEDVKQDNMTIVTFMKMPWHDVCQVKRYLIQEILGRKEDIEGMTMLQAFECIPMDQCIVLMLDGLSQSERTMLKSAALKVGGRQTLVLVMTSDDADSESLVGVPGTIMIPPLDSDDRKELVQGRAEQMHLSLSDEEVEEIACKEDAGMPQYVVYALGSLGMQDSAEENRDRVADLPGTLDDLLLDEEFGVLASLEASFGKSFVRSFLFWFAFISPALRLADVGVLLASQVSALPDQFWSDVETTFSLFVHGYGRLSVMPSSLVDAARRRYGWESPASLDEFASYQAERMHLQFETDKSILQSLVTRCKDVDTADPEVKRAGAWLDSEALLADTLDMDSLEQLVVACGQLSGSSDLDDAKLKLEVRSMLGKERDLGRLATLSSGYGQDLRFKMIEAEDAKRLVVCERRLAQEHDYRKMVALVQTLEGYTGPQLDEARDILKKVGLLSSATSLDVLRGHMAICGAIRACDIVNDALTVFDLEDAVASEMDVERISESVSHYNKLRVSKFRVLERSENLRKAEEILAAEAILRAGEANIAEVGRCVKICEGVSNSTALDRCRAALIAEAELASEKRCSEVKRLLGQCSFLTGSAVVEHKEQVVRFEKRLRTWVPFTLIHSLAKKLKATLGSDDMRDRIQALFAEIDTDNSGFITRDEMERALERLGVQISKVEMENFMQGMGAESTGEVDQLEFMTFVESLISKSDAIVSEDEELEGIGRLIEGIQDDLEESNAVEEARFKILLNTAQRVNDVTWLTDFFKVNEEQLSRSRLTSPEIVAKRNWVEAEQELTLILKQAAHVVRPTMPKRDLWAVMQRCGGLENSTSLLRAKRIMDAEKDLMFENSASKIRELLKLCGILVGSPAVQRARKLLSAEINLERTISGVQCSTIEAIKHAIQQCFPLTGFEALDEARVVVACELVLEKETRSAAMRRVLPLCECVRLSHVLDRCRKILEIEDALAEIVVGDENVSPLYTLNPTDIGASAKEVVGEEVYYLLAEKASSFTIHQLRLATDITDSDVLRQQVALCGSQLSESVVLDQARKVVEALDRLPWTDSLDEMSHVRDAIVKQLGSKYLSPERQRAKLRRIFDDFDEDGSGAIDRDEIDRAFFLLGVHINSWDLEKLMSTYDADGTGDIDFPEFEQMVELMIRGSKWSNSTDLADIRDSVAICGYLKSGRHTEWLFLAKDWLKAVEKLERGVFEHQELLETVDACGPITGSAAIDQAVLVLQAAVELQVAATDERIHEMMALCGHLSGLEVLRQKRSWLDAEDQLRALNYHLESSEWLPSSHAQLWKIAEACGGLTASQPLQNAMLALQAETDLGRTQDGAEIQRLLGICGHLSESQMIDQRRSWIAAEQELRSAVDLARVKQLCETCSELQNSEIVAASRFLLEVESNLSKAFTEEDLRDGLATLEGKITGSDNIREAALRYQQFSMRRKALDTMHRTTDSTELKDCLQTLLLCNLFTSLDLSQVGHLTFKDVRSALLILGIQPDVDAIGAATALFDVPETVGLSVFLHLSLGNVGRDLETLVDAGVIVQTMHEKGIVPKAILVEEVLELLHAGEPDSRIYYESFKTFLCTQMDQNDLDVKTLRTKMPDFKLPEEIEHKVKWIEAELTLALCCNYAALLQAIEKCSDLTGSAMLDEARGIVVAAKAVAFEPDIDVVRELLAKCGHLEGCQSVTDAKSFLVMERWLSQATDHGAIKFYLHACNHLNSPAITAAKELMSLHDSLLDHVLGRHRDKTLAVLEELGNRISSSQIMQVASCWTAISAVLAAEQTGSPNATAVSEVLSTLDQDFGVAVRDYYSAISEHLRCIKGGNEGAESAPSATLPSLYASLHALEEELMEIFKRMKRLRPTAPMVQSVVDQTLLLNQWKIMLDPFLDGVCKDVNPRILSGYVALCVDSRRWSRCAEVVSNLFYLRSRIYDVGVSALITDIASMVRAAEQCGQIHPMTMRKLYATAWFCESRRKQLESSRQLLPLCLESVGLHASRHDSRSTFSSAHYAQEGSQPSLPGEKHAAHSAERRHSTVEWEGSGKIGWEGSGKVGWEGSGKMKMSHAQIKVIRQDSALECPEEDSSFPALTVNGYGELFSLKSLELEMQEVAEKLVDRAKNAITAVELLSTAFRPNAVLTGKKAVLKARDTVRGLHFLRVVCALGLEDALPDKNWVRRLSCVLEEEALHEPLKTHAHAASLDEYMDIVLDAVSSDVVNWEMGDVFLSVSDIWQSWISARWHRRCLLLKVQNDASTRMGRKWIENNLVSALQECSEIPRGSFEVESLSDETVLVEITSRYEVSANVAKLQRQIVDPASEFHKVCDREVSLGYLPGEWRQLQLAICDPRFLDEEISFLAQFVLPALQTKCQREGLKVTLDWRVLPREQLAGADDTWKQAIRLPEGCFIGAPGEAGVGRPFFLVLGGEVEECDPEDEYTVPLQHLCELCCGGKSHTEGVVTLSSSEGEPRSSRSKVRSAKGKASSRAFESAYRVLQAAEARSAASGASSPGSTRSLSPETSPVERGGSRPSSPPPGQGLLGAVLRAGTFKDHPGRSPGRSGDNSRDASSSSASSVRSPIAPFAAATHQRQASHTLLREGKQASRTPVTPVSASKRPLSAAELRRDLKAVTAIRYCEYPPNIQRSMERNVIKASYGLSAEHVCRLAEFGLMMMDRLWNTIQAHCSSIEQERNVHHVERIAHARRVNEVIKGVKVCETGVQKRVLSEALARTSVQGSVTRVGGSPGSGKSVILSMLAANLMARPSMTEKVVVFIKMPWHTTAHLTRYMCLEILGAAEDVEQVSVSQAFSRIPAQQRYIFVLDGLSSVEQTMVASAVIESEKQESFVVIMSCDSMHSDEEDGGQGVIPLPSLDMDDRRELVLTQSARMGLMLAADKVDVLIRLEDAGSPQFLKFALGNLCVHETLSGVQHESPGSMDQLLMHDQLGVLCALEAMHGQQLVSTFFRWFVVFEKGISASDLNILLRENADMQPMQMPHRSAALLPVPKPSLDALFTQASYFLAVSTCNADSQPTCFISSPAMMRAVCARYKSVPPTSAWLSVAIHCDNQMQRETDLRTLKTMVDITADFGSSVMKRKVVSWIEAETRLAHVNDFNALRAAVSACGKLTGSDELLKAQQAFEAVRVLAYERDIEKVRTLCHNYRIVTSHPNVDYAREILKTEAEMVMERRIEVLTKLYQKCQRYHGSAIISKVANILAAEQELPNLTSFFDIRRSLSVCAGIVGSPRVENAKAVVSAVEHLTLRKQLPKVLFDSLVHRVPESRELMLRYWIIHPRVRPPTMIWNEDTTNTLRRHQSKLRGAATELQVDPAPILEEFWESFDEIVMKLTIARDLLEKEEGTVVMLEEDHNSIIQDALLKCHFITDVPIIKLMMRRRQAAADLAHERRIAVIQEKLEICGMIRSNRTVDAAKEALRSEKGLLSERHVPTIKRLMDKCQWLENSEGVLWAADVLDRIERMRPFIYTAGAGFERPSSTGSEAAGEEQGHIPAKDLKEFLEHCSSLTGSDVIDRACEMAASMARLEQDKDGDMWKNLLRENGWYERHPRELSTQTSWDQMEVSSLLKICSSVYGDDVLNRARRYVSSSKELTRLITPHINIGIRQLKEVLKQCGPLCGMETAKHTVERVHKFHLRIKPEEKTWLVQLLEAWRRPNENVEFVGWEKIVDFLPQVLPSSALTDILPAISVERARRCVEALRQIESDNPPTSVPTLQRLMAECSQVPMSNKLDFLRRALIALSNLKRNRHIDAVRLAVSLCSQYDSSESPALSLAREQVVALELIETELHKDALVRLVGCCEGLVGSPTLDRDRGWLAADAKLETERRVPQVRKLLELCGDLQDSRNMDTARTILDRLAALIESRDAVEVRKLVEYLDSETVTENPHLDETRTVLMLETSLPSRVQSIDLVHALIQVDERLTGSALSEAAHVRLHVMLETEWKAVCDHNTLPVLRKFHELGLEMVQKSGFNYAYLSNLHAGEGKDFMQAWTEVGARLLAVDNLKGETDFRTISDLLKVIGVINECPIVDEARGWIESIHALERERDSKLVEELVAKCGPVAGSDVLALAKQRVLTLAALEQGDASTFDIHVLREYCVLCEHLFGNPFLDKCRAAVAAVDKLQEFNHIGAMHRYTRMWAPLKRPDLPSTTQQIFQLVNVLERNKEIAVMRDAAAPLRALQKSDEIRHSSKWLQVLHVSKDLRNETFAVVTKEPRHVTVSEQAQQMHSCLGLSQQVTGDATLDMAREVEAFFRPEQPPADNVFCRVPQDLGLVEGLKSKQRGKQMEALLACLQAALQHEVFLAACVGLDAEDALKEERALPKVAELVAKCDEFSSPTIAKAKEVLTAEKQLIHESEYVALKELLEKCEGYTGSKALDMARHKMATLDALEGCVDYFKIRDVVPHVNVTGCQALEDAQWIDFLVRDMMQTRSVGRLQQILQELSEKRVVGFPEMDRVRDLLELEKQIDGIKELDQLSAALKRIGNRISDSEKIKAAKSRHDQLAHAVGEKSRCNDLSSAAFWGNTMAIEYFLELDPEGVHQRNEQGETPLFSACAGGVISGARLLLSRGATPHTSAKNGSTPLHAAAAAGHCDIVLLLLPLCLDTVDAQATVLRHTPLLLAAKEGHTDVVEVLLERGSAHIDAADANGNTAVMRALAAGHRDTAKLLVKRHCSLRATNSDGYTCLHLAARMGYAGLASKCVRLGLNVTARTRAGYSTLHLAAMAGEADLCAFLLRKGAEVNERDGWGSTALHHASRAGSAEVVRVLLLAGADPRIRNWEGRGWKAMDMSASKEVDAMLYKGLYPLNTDFDDPEMGVVEEHDTSTVLNISLPAPQAVTREESRASGKHDGERGGKEGDGEEEDGEKEDDEEETETETETDSEAAEIERERAALSGVMLRRGSGWAVLRGMRGSLMQMLPKPEEEAPEPGPAAVDPKARKLPVKVLQRGRTPLASSLATTPALSHRSQRSQGSDF